MAAADRLGIRRTQVDQAVGTPGGVTNDVPLPPRSVLSRLAGELSGVAMSEHTKTPWGAHPWFNDQVLITDDLLARHIAVTCSGVLEKQANAAFIVTACNAHDAMKEALWLLLNRYVDLANCGDCGNWDPELEESVINARKALALTEAKP